MLHSTSHSPFLNTSNTGSSRTLPLPIHSHMSSSIMERRRLPSMRLTKSSQWSFVANKGDPAYISPPMSNSPTSPKRSQFPQEERSSTVSYEAPTGSLQSGLVAPATNMMTSQVYSTQAPVHPPQFGTGALQPQHHYGEARPDIQPRPRAQSIPPYQTGFQQTAYPHHVLPHPGHGVPAYMGPAMVGTAVIGPVSIPTQNVPRIPRVTPRRGKAHVAKACQNCKKAHLSCDDQRPCGRCVATRKEATCIDVEHKKRGRPRIMTDRSQQQRDSPVRPLSTQSSLARDLYHGGAGLRAQAERRPSLPVGGTGLGLGSGVSIPPVPRSAGPDVTTFSQRGPDRFHYDNLVAYLNMEFNILKVSDSLRVHLGGQDVVSRPLQDFVDSTHHAEIQALQNQLRDERLHADPMELPAIRGAEQLAVQALDQTDADRVTSGYRDKEGYWLFNMPGGKRENMKFIISLARTSTFFVTLILRPLSPISASAPGQGFQTIRSQPMEFAAPVPTNPSFNPLPRETHFVAPGPSSPFHRSGDTSPFSTLPQHLSTTLPPVPIGHASASPGREQQFSSGGYFSRQPLQTTTSPGGARMQPPPQPPLLSRESSVREPRRPEALGNLNLPPILSTSAPTTPNNPEASFDTPGSSGNAPGSSSTMLEPSSSRSQRRSSVERADEADDETSRKRRRLEIGGLIEK